VEVPEAAKMVDLGKVRCRGEMLAKAGSSVPVPEPVPAAATATPIPTATSTPTATATSTSTSTATATPTPTPTSTSTRTRIAKASAPAPRPSLPPRVGLGPPSPRCPACAVCFLAALDRLSASRYTLRCVRDLAFIEPELSRSEAAKACMAAPDYGELCAECREIRIARSCPTWAVAAPARTAADGRSARR
jgi:hypothetical protein